MHELASSLPFDLTGIFDGIILTYAGKRRLRLRVGETERLLKVPRELRRRMIGNFQLGQTIRVSGVEERDLASGTSKWVVARVLPLEAEVATITRVAIPSGTIRVCAKKDCWRQGGRELFNALENGIEARGLTGQLRVKAVSCLDRCKQGPNIDWGDQEFTHCTLQDADAMLAHAAATLKPAGQPADE